MTARERLNALLESCSGIAAARGGIDANLDAFLARRLPETRLANLDEYLTRLAHDGAELELLLDQVTITHTWFMRDPGQLAIVSELMARRAPTAPALRVWVPGCATGEDAYSIAMLAEQAGRTVEVLGTDINTGALRSARTGIYGSWSARELAGIDRFFERGERDTLHIAERFKRCVSFERHNLIEPPPHADWDVVLCRNVLIYLGRERARRVIEALADSLAPSGYLLLGASEVVFEPPPRLEATYVCDRLALRRRASSGPVPAPAGQAPRAAARTLGTAALLQRGHDRLDRSDLNAAISDYEQAIENDATLAEPHLYLGIALYASGALERALHELRAAAFLDGSLWPAMFYSALCYEALGQLEDAQREYRHVVRVAARAQSSALPRQHSAWQQDLIQLAQQRSGSAA